MAEKRIQIEKAGNTEIVFDVGKYYGELEPGHYSVIKELYYTYPTNGREERVSVSAAFRILE